MEHNPINKYRSFCYVGSKFILMFQSHQNLQLRNSLWSPLFTYILKTSKKKDRDTIGSAIRNDSANIK